MTPLRLIFAGSGAFGLPTLLALKSNVVQVVSQPDRPAGRGRKTMPTPLAQFALEQNLRLIRTDDVNSLALPPADAMVVIAFGQKLSPRQVNHPRLGSVNLHASLLPKFRGAAPIVWTILSGEQFAGNSVIRLAEKMDAGAILAQAALEIGPVETAGELHDRLAAAGAPLIEKVLDDLAAGRAVEQAQDESKASSAPKLSRADAAIDWSQTPEVIARRIRGLWPWPGCRVRMLDAAGGEIARLSLARARAVETEGCRWHDGEIETTGHICAGGGAGAVEILEVQPEGGRVMSLSDFRRGHVWMAGMKLSSIQ
jgi:methionyl-tRNA formyltransferase